MNELHVTLIVDEDLDITIIRDDEEDWRDFVDGATNTVKHVSIELG